MIDVPGQWPAEFTITYTDDELRSYRKMIAAQYARSDDWGWIFAIPLVSLFVLGAFELDLVTPTSVRSVLFTAYAAFILGAASYYASIRRYFHKLTHNDGWRGSPWNWRFDEIGIRYWSKMTDVRLAWGALDRVEDLGSMVFLRMGRHGLCIPSRLFPDDAARAGFVAEVRTRIEAAVTKV